MATKELIEWIERQKERGVHPDHVHETLVDTGWKPDVARDAISNVYEELKEEEEDIKEKIYSVLEGSPATFIIILIAGLSVAGGLFYFGVNNADFSPSVESPSQDMWIAQDVDEEGCKQFAQDLFSCEPSICQFKRGEEYLTREVFSLGGGECQYVEQMPGGGKMECVFSEEVRKPVARYYMDLGLPDNSSLDLSMQSGNETYEMGDENVTNPISEALKRGECRVTGYDDSNNTVQ